MRISLLFFCIPPSVERLWFYNNDDVDDAVISPLLKYAKNSSNTLLSAHNGLKYILFFTCKYGRLWQLIFLTFEYGRWFYMGAMWNDNVLIIWWFLRFWSTRKIVVIHCCLLPVGHNGFRYFFEKSFFQIADMAVSECHFSWP